MTSSSYPDPAEVTKPVEVDHCDSIRIELQTYVGTATQAQIEHLCAKAYLMIHQSTLAMHPVEPLMWNLARGRMWAFVSRMISEGVISVGNVFCDVAENPPEVKHDVAITVNFRFSLTPLESHWIVLCAQEQTATLLRSKGLPAKSIESYGVQSADLLNTAR